MYLQDWLWWLRCQRAGYMGVCETKSNLAQRPKPPGANATCICLDVRGVGLAKREAHGKYLSWRQGFRSLVHMWVMRARGMVKTVQRKVNLAATGLLTISLSSKLPRNSELPKHLQLRNTHLAHLPWLPISSAWGCVCSWLVMSFRTRGPDTGNKVRQERFFVWLPSWLLAVPEGETPLSAYLFKVLHFSHKKLGSKRMSIPQVLCVFMLH